MEAKDNLNQTLLYFALNDVLLDPQIQNKYQFEPKYINKICK